MLPISHYLPIHNFTFFFIKQSLYISSLTYLCKFSLSSSSILLVLKWSMLIIMFLRPISPSRRNRSNAYLTSVSDCNPVKIGMIFPINKMSAAMLWNYCLHHHTALHYIKKGEGFREGQPGPLGPFRPAPAGPNDAPGAGLQAFEMHQIGLAH